MPDRTSAQKRRSFLVLVLVLVAVTVAVAFALSPGGDGASSSASTPGGSGGSDVVDLQTACGEIAPDMAFRVDSLRRTAALVRVDIATMQAQGNDADAAKATTVAEALERLADAEESQRGVSRATRGLGQTLVSVC